MTTPGNADLGPLLERSDPTMQRLLSDLNSACDVRMPAGPRVEIAQCLADASHQPPASPRSSSRRWLQPRLTSLVVAVAIVVAGVLGYGRFQSPAAVSAAQILRRAADAAARVPAGDAVHTVIHMYVVKSDIPLPYDDITFEKWTQVNGNGQPMQIDQVERSSNPESDERVVAESDGTLWMYSGIGHTASRSTWTPGTPLFPGPSTSHGQGISFLPKELMDGPQDPVVMGNLLIAAASGAYEQLKLLDQQVIDGRTMDVVRASLTSNQDGSPLPQGWAREVYTIDLDSSTHLARRITVSGVNDRGSALYDEVFDVKGYDTVPIAEIPPGTFTFTPPPGTRVCTPPNRSTPAACTTVTRNRRNR
jgi:hypothetical protein